MVDEGGGDRFLGRVGRGQELRGGACECRKLFLAIVVVSFGGSRVENRGFVQMSTGLRGSAWSRC